MYKVFCKAQMRPKASFHSFSSFFFCFLFTQIFLVGKELVLYKINYVDTCGNDTKIDSHLSTTLILLTLRVFKNIL